MNDPINCKEKKDNQKQFEEKLNEIKKTHPRFSMTRRELLAHGLIDGVTMVMLPTFFQELLRIRAAQAADLSFPALLQVHCNGGAGLGVRNAIPFQANGDFIPTGTIGRIGLPSGIASQGNAMITPFGNPERGRAFTFANPDTQTTIAGIPRGMLRGAGGLSAAEAGRLRVCGVANSSQDDGGGDNNRVGMGAAAAVAGLQGRFAGIIGNQNTVSGATNLGRLVEDARQVPLFIRSVTELVSATTPGAILAGINNTDQFASSLSELNASQVRSLNSLPDHAQFEALSQSANAKMVLIAKSQTSVDVRVDAQLAPIFGVNSTTNVADPNAVYGTFVKAILEKNVGSAVYSIGGCDYHLGGPRAAADAKDIEIGLRIAQASKAAIAKGVDLVIMVDSNGSVVSDEAGTVLGDSGQRSYYYFIYVNGSNRPMPSQQIAQLGSFNTAAVAVTDNNIGGADGMQAARAMFANYLALSGMPLSEIQKMFPALTMAQLQTQMIFNLG